MSPSLGDHCVHLKIRSSLVNRPMLTEIKRSDLKTSCSCVIITVVLLVRPCRGDLSHDLRPKTEFDVVRLWSHGHRTCVFNVLEIQNGQANPGCSARFQETGGRSRVASGRSALRGELPVRVRVLQARREEADRR